MRHTARNFGNVQGALAVQRSQDYASAADFCAIFRNNTESLYTLAVSLTGSHKLAHEAFVAALDDCREGRAVFQDWAALWSRRAVIKSAIRLLDQPESDANDSTKAELESIATQMDGSGAWFLRLDRLERMVFVISVLEGYTVRECATLLKRSPREVEQARLRAFQQLAANHNIVQVPYVNQTQDIGDSLLLSH